MLGRSLRILCVGLLLQSSAVRAQTRACDPAVSASSDDPQPAVQPSGDATANADVARQAVRRGTRGPPQAQGEEEEESQHAGRSSSAGGVASRWKAPRLDHRLGGENRPQGPARERLADRDARDWFGRPATVLERSTNRHRGHSVQEDRVRGRARTGDRLRNDQRPFGKDSVAGRLRQRQIDEGLRGRSRPLQAAVRTRRADRRNQSGLHLSLVARAGPVARPRYRSDGARPNRGTTARISGRIFHARW